MGNRLDIPLPEYPLEIVFVLVKPAFSGNIGAVCRGMLNFGFSKLRIIGHDGEWDEETRKRAKHAQSVLDNAEVFESDAVGTLVTNIDFIFCVCQKRFCWRLHIRANSDCYNI